MKQDVLAKFESYPEDVKPLMYALRELIHEVAAEDGINDLDECLKWGEPSYLCKHGSTLRIDWKAKEPHQYAIYFHCQTALVATFREIYPQELEYEGNRAILFQLDQSLPRKTIKHCVSLALRYHLVKGQPLLGA